MMRSRKDCLRGLVCTPTSFGEAIACPVFHSPKRARQIAAEMGVSYGYLRAAARATRHDSQFQGRLLERLIAVTGSLVPLRWISHTANCVAIRLPQQTAGAEELFLAFTRVVTEVGEDSELIRAALDPSGAGGARVTDDEGEKLIRSLDETLEVIVAMKATVLSSVRAKSAMQRMDLTSRADFRRSA